MNSKNLEYVLSVKLFEKWLKAVADKAKDDAEKVAKDPSQPSFKWMPSAKNIEIKRKFKEEIDALTVGMDNKIEVRYSGKCKEDAEDLLIKKNSEFLYDISVLEWEYVEGKDEIFVSNILAMELEFSDSQMRKGKKGGFKFDFHKLLQSDAPFKVFCFYKSDKKGDASITKELRELKELAERYKSRCNSKLLIWCCGRGKDRGLYSEEVILKASP